jgi:hypothetical protein
VARAQERGVPIELRSNRASLAVVYWERGMVQEMRDCYQNCIPVVEELTDFDIYQLFVYVAHIAFVLASYGQLMEAAHLLAAVDRIFAERDYVRGYFHDRYYEPAMDRLHHSLDPSMLQAARNGSCTIRAEAAFEEAVKLLVRCLPS